MGFALQKKGILITSLKLPCNRNMECRIRVNQGDLVHEEGRVYGDKVNIATRLESLTGGGGIRISGKFYEEVKSKLGFGVRGCG